MKLVDVEEVHEIFNWSHQKPPYSKKTIHRYIDMAREVDVVPVIRCKDCKWWSADTCMEWYDTPYTPADGYCFRAERKEQ